MISIITGHRALKPVWLALAGAGLLAASGCDKLPLLAPSLSTISLSSSTSIVQANGTAEIRATVLESSGTPVQNGTAVTFTTNLGTISPTDARTLNGVATAQFVANGQSGIAEIHATSGSAKSADSTSTTSVSPSIKLTVGGAAVGRIGLTANPTTVASAGGTSTIAANVVDANGNPLSSVSVTFSTTAGSLSTAVATTDASGNAQTTLTTNKDATVTATAGGGTTGTGTATTAPTGTVTVKVNIGPTVAVPTASPSAPLVGQIVSFSVSATAGAAGSPVQRIVVDFGDGGSTTINGSSGSATRTYTRAGTYSVRATAFDALGDSGSNILSVTVTASTKPSVAISASASPTVGTPTTFTYTANTTQAGTSMDAVSVNYGDGTTTNFGNVTGTGLTAQHVYVRADTYTVTITATDSNGSTASASTVIVVQPILVNLSIGKSTTAPSTITFTATVTPTGAAISNYHWIFDDSASPTPIQDTSSNTTSHNYVKVGAITASVTVTTPNGQTASASTSFQVP